MGISEVNIFFSIYYDQNTLKNIFVINIDLSFSFYVIFCFSIIFNKSFKIAIKLKSEILLFFFKFGIDLDGSFGVVIGGYGGKTIILKSVFEYLNNFQKG